MQLYEEYEKGLFSLIKIGNTPDWNYDKPYE